MIIPDEVKRLARAGKDKKIHAIAALRRATGMGLAEAKEIIETIAAGGEVQLADPAPASPIGETREQRLRRQLEAIGRTGRVGYPNNEKIVRKLLEILRADEELIYLAQGTYDNSNGVLAVTQNRLLFLSAERDFGPSRNRVLKIFGISPLCGNVSAIPVMTIKWESPLDSIYLVHHRPGMHESSIKIFMQGYERAEFTGMEKDDARSLAESLDRRVDSRLDEFGKSGQYDQDYLEQAEALFDKGIITGEELAHYKRRVLHQMRRQSKPDSGGKSRPS